MKKQSFLEDVVVLIYHRIFHWKYHSSICSVQDQDKQSSIYAIAEHVLSIWTIYMNEILWMRLRIFFCPSVYATRGGEFIGITGTIDKQSWSLLKQGAVLVVHINHVDDGIDGDQR